METYIIGGKWRNRKIETGKNLDFRPTMGRVRSALFNILLHKSGFLTDFPPLDEANFLDLCCGPGSCGLEAASRGAKNVCFVDKSPVFTALTKKNAENLGMVAGKDFEIFTADAQEIANYDLHPHFKYDMIFVDPPYKKSLKLIRFVAENLIKSRNIAQNPLLICESAIADLDVPEPWVFRRQDKYGGTYLSYFTMDNLR